jgi:hypothetical protein
MTTWEFKAASSSDALENCKIENEARNKFHPFATNSNSPQHHDQHQCEHLPAAKPARVKFPPTPKFGLVSHCFAHMH